MTEKKTLSSPDGDGQSSNSALSALDHLKSKGNFGSAQKASKHVQFILKQYLRHKRHPVIAEIGIGVGATCFWLATQLKNKGTIHLFDWEDRIHIIGEVLRSQGFGNITYHSNSRKVFDGYYWPLAKIALANRTLTEPVFFDFVYLDGAHMFHQDGPSACILKGLIRPGGFILFDDADWSINASPSLKPSVFPESANWFTPEQRDTAHIGMICDLFFEMDADWERLELPVLDQSSRRLYRRNRYRRSYSRVTALARRLLKI